MTPSSSQWFPSKNTSYLVNGRRTAALREEFLFLGLSGWTFRKYGICVSIMDV
jgi:hypothetical protein